MPRPGRGRWWLVAAFVVAACAVCVRLGFWQLERHAAKDAQLREARSALAQPPRVLEALPVGDTLALGVRVELRGTWERAHLLLSGRTHLSEPGVSWVTPLVLASGERVLVERGWVAAPDGRASAPSWLASDATARVTGVVQPFARVPRPATWARLPEEPAGVVRWSVRALERDSCVARLGALAPFVVRELPPSPPRAREAGPQPEPYDLATGSVHLSYAVQWFGIALVVLAGAVALGWRGRRRESARA